MGVPGMQDLRDWLADHWVAAAGFMAAALLAVAPVILLPALTFLIFLHSPAYMLHQVEEHTGGRFQRFANERIFGGEEALTIAAILVINLPLVWGVNLLALYAAYAFGPAWGLVASYLMLVNAITHLAAAMRFRAYNPGLATSILVFLPLSLVTIWGVGWSSGIAPHLVGAIVSIAVHAAIVVWVVRRSRRLLRSRPL
jgi:uncharacterized membrane protein